MTDTFEPWIPIKKEKPPTNHFDLLLYRLGGRTNSDVRYESDKAYVWMADGTGGLYKYFI